MDAAARRILQPHGPGANDVRRRTAIDSRMEPVRLSVERRPLRGCRGGLTRSGSTAANECGRGVSAGWLQDNLSGLPSGRYDPAAAAEAGPVEPRNRQD